jgi:hypothetical protein
MTRTVAPLDSGRSDQARKASEPAADLDEHLTRPGVAPSRYEENW